MKQINKDFGDKVVRIIETTEDQYFVLADVCKVLEINHTAAVKKRIPERMVAMVPVVDRLGRNQQKCSAVNEDGLLEAVANSKKKSIDFKSEFLTALNINPQKVICKRRSEEEFISTLEIVVKQLPITLLKQKHVSKYNVDIFIPEINLVIEYDEDNHRNYCKLTERKREKEIRWLLDCELIRISDRETHLENVSIVLGKIFEIFNRRDSLESTYKSI